MQAPCAAVQEQLAGILQTACDEHGWRARSLASVLTHVSTSDTAIRPDDLAALAEAIEEHVQGLADAVSHGHDLLTGRVRALGGNP